ncbi:MAG: reverse transcriptase domain-containing protein, partial [Chlamydiota bacterium]
MGPDHDSDSDQDMAPRRGRRDRSNTRNETEMGLAEPSKFYDTFKLSAAAPKLVDERKFTSWYKELNNLLRLHGLEHFLDEEPQPDNSSEIKGDRITRHIISEGIQSIMKPSVLSAKSAKEMINIIKDSYGRFDIAIKQELMENLYRTTIIASENPTPYVMKIINAAGDLKEMNMGIPEDHLHLVILCSLPTEYSLLVTQLQHELKNGSLNTNDIRRRITSFYYINLAKKNNTEKRQIMAASQPSPKRRQKAAQQTWKGLYCDICKKKGHTWDKCRAHLQCTVCKKKYHSAEQCWHNKNREKEKKEVTINSLLNTCDDDEKPTSCFILDSGSTEHVCPYVLAFTKLEDISPPIIIETIGGKVEVTKKGEITTDLHGKEGYFQAKIKNVLYMESAPYGILSVEKLRLSGFEILFKKSRVIVSKDYFETTLWNKNNLVYFKCFDNNTKKSESAYSCVFTINKSSPKLWHARFNHLNKNDLLNVQKMVEGMDDFSVASLMDCLVCIENKFPRKSFKRRRTIPNGPLDEICSDIMGPIFPSTMGGNRKYVLVFIDVYSNYLWIYLLRHKSEVAQTFEVFLRESERKVGTHIKKVLVVKKLHTDNGGEYLAYAFQDRLKELGIQHTTVIPYTPEQNGLAERYNRTLMEKTKCILNESGFPKSLWGEAILNVARVLNFSPTRKPVDKTPHEAFKLEKPNVKYLRKFGSMVYFHIPKEKRTKLDPNNKRGYLLGYTDVIGQYRIYVPEEKCVILSSSVKILEDILYKDVHKDKEGIQDNLQSWFFENTTDLDQIVPIPNLSRKNNCSDEQNQNSPFQEETAKSDDEGKETEVPNLQEKQLATDSLQSLNHVNLLHEEAIPHEIDLDIEKAKRHPKWMEAIEKELNSIKGHNVYQEVDRPYTEHTLLDLRWVFTIKPGGLYKARLVAKGFRQKGGIDYFETYSPVIDVESLRILLVYAFVNDYSMLQLDVKTAFLYGELDEEIYCRQPPGFAAGNKVWKLKKSLYGLKQAPRCWNHRLHDFLITLGFTRNCAQPCMYHHHKDQVHLGVYVDDMILIAKTTESLSIYKDLIKNEFEIKDLGYPKTILGIDVSIKENAIYLSQESYIKNILKTFNMENCNGVSTPMTLGTKLQKSEKYDEKYPYRNAIGMLTYLSTRTRPDIAYTVHKLAQFN